MLFVCKKMCDSLIPFFFISNVSKLLIIPFFFISNVSKSLRSLTKNEWSWAICSPKISKLANCLFFLSESLVFCKKMSASLRKPMRNSQPCRKKWIRICKNGCGSAKKWMQIHKKWIRIHKEWMRILKKCMRIRIQTELWYGSKSKQKQYGSKQKQYGSGSITLAVGSRSANEILFLWIRYLLSNDHKSWHQDRHWQYKSYKCTDLYCT